MSSEVNQQTSKVGRPVFQSMFGDSLRLRLHGDDEATDPGTDSALRLDNAVLPVCRSQGGEVWNPGT